MKVNSTNPFAPASRVEKTKSVSKSERVAEAGPAAATEPVDEISKNFMGIPAEEMTPKVQKAITTLLQEVDALRQELRSAQARLADLERLADTDTLAPVANRRAFVRELSKSISYAKRHAISASLLYFDVNDLKKINDEMGHSAGDKVLSHVANTLLINLRESDVVGRLGGDEFAALLMQATEQQAMEKGSQLVRLIAETPVNLNGKMVQVRVAFGAYTFEDIDDPGDALHQADRRMYAHKKMMKDEPPLAG